MLQKRANSDEAVRLARDLEAIGTELPNLLGPPFILSLCNRFGRQRFEAQTHEFKEFGKATRNLNVEVSWPSICTVRDGHMLGITQVCAVHHNAKPASCDMIGGIWLDVIGSKLGGCYYTTDKKIHDAFIKSNYTMHYISRTPCLC